jgi:hypothetical protein
MRHDTTYKTVKKNKIIKQIKLFKPHGKQLEILEFIENEEFNNIVICAGRRFGKTMLCCNVLLKWAIDNKNTENGYICYSHDQRKVVFTEFINLFKHLKLFSYVNNTECTIHLKNNSKIFFRLGSYPAVENLRGRKFSLLILDEFSSFKRGVYASVLQPTFATMQKYKAIFISTPKGKGEFWELYNKGVSGEKGWKSFRFKTEDSPYVNKQFLKDVESQIPEHIFRQEYLAEFLTNGGEVFNNIDKCIDDTVHQPIRKKDYVMGVDVGIKNDYTVCTVVDYNNVVQEIQRFNQIEMREIVTRIKNLSQKWNDCNIRVENNMYQGVVEMLREEGCNVKEFNTNMESKKKIIERLCVLFENEKIRIPNNQILIDELINYTYTYNETTRNVSYNAPAGLHDDCVMSLAIACWYTKFN